MLNLEDIDLIEDYLKGNIQDEKTLGLIEKRINEDADYALSIRIHKYMLRGMGEIGKQQIKKLHRRITEEMEENGFWLTDQELAGYLAESMVDGGKVDEIIRQKVERRKTEDPDFGEHLDKIKESILEDRIERGAYKTGKKELTKELASIQGKLESEGFFDEFEKGDKKGPENKKGGEGGIIRSLNFRLVAVAAAVALLVGAFFVVPPLLQPDDFFADMFEPTPDGISKEWSDGLEPVNGAATGLSPEEKESVKSLTIGFEAYTSGDYSKAIKHISEGIEEAPYGFPEDLEFYLAESYLANGEPEKAVGILEKIVVLNFDFKETAQWHLALTYLELKQTEKAKPLLKSLVDSKSDAYRKNAQTILDTL